MASSTSSTVPTGPAPARRRNPLLLFLLPIVALVMGFCAFMDPDDARVTLPPCHDPRTGVAKPLTPEGAPTVADSQRIARENAAGRQVYPTPGVDCADSEALVQHRLQQPWLLVLAIVVAVAWLLYLLRGSLTGRNDDDDTTPRRPAPTNPPTFVPPAPPPSVPTRPTDYGQGRRDPNRSGG